MWELVSSHQEGTKMEKKGIALSSYLLMRTTSTEYLFWRKHS